MENQRDSSGKIRTLQEIAEINIVIISKYQTQLTIDKILEFPTISQLKIEFGEKKVIAILATIIQVQCMQFNISNRPSEAQILSIAMVLMEEVSLSIQDILLIFKKAKRGEFDTIYNRIDSEIIYKWIMVYNCLKEAEREKVMHNLKYDFPPSDALAPLVIEKIKVILEEKTIKTKEKIVKKRPTNEDFECEFQLQIPSLGTENLIEWFKSFMNYYSPLSDSFSHRIPMELIIIELQSRNAIDQLISSTNSTILSKYFGVK